MKKTLLVTISIAIMMLFILSACGEPSDTAKAQTAYEAVSRGISGAVPPDIDIAGNTYTYTFDNFYDNASGCTINGSISGSFTQSGSSITIVQQGNLTFSGAVSASIAIDFTMTVDGTFYSFTGTITVNGDVFDVSTLN